MKKIGYIVLLVGLGLTIFTTISFITKKKVVDLGSVEITTNKPHQINWSPLLGVAVMGIGGVMIWMSYKNKNT